MKLIIEKDILVTNLEIVSRALSTRNIIPVLNGIKFNLCKEGLYLTASDNDISIEALIDKKDIKSIDEKGELVIAGGSKLLEILKKLPNSELVIESYEDNEINFNTPSFEYKSNCFLKEDYPNIKFEDSNESIQLDAFKLKEIISKTSFACSTQESRPLLTGVNIKTIGNLFECVATDSFRLSKIQLDLPNINNNFNIVIPSRNINELNKIITKDGIIDVNVFNNKILFKFENIKFQTSLLNGTYPNTDNSIPKEFKNNIKVNLKELIGVVDRASLITQSKDKNIIEMEIKNNNLTIRASSVDIGKIEETINVENISENSIKISFSAKYMMDALKIFNKENINLLLNGEISPIIITEDENNEVTELILPMKTF